MPDNNKMGGGVDDVSAKVAQIVKRLPAGAKRAMAGMTDEWQFAGKATFNANGAWSAHWARGMGGRGSLVEYEVRMDGKWSRPAYRLTPLGSDVAAAIRLNAASAAHLPAAGSTTSTVEASGVGRKFA